MRAKSTDASVPLEIKVAESWNLQELEDALRLQLCEKYLRARDARHGILLLVHNKPRPKGWFTRTGRRLVFSEVLALLKAMAAKIASSATNAPQPEIATLDMTSFAKTLKRKPARHVLVESPKAKLAKGKRVSTKKRRKKSAKE